MFIDIKFPLPFKDVGGVMENELFPDSNMDAKNPHGTSMVALDPFNDDPSALSVTGYAQESHVRLVADPNKVGRYHDGRPRPHDPFTCFLCQEEHADGPSLFNHMRAMHKAVWTENVCPICGKQLGDKACVTQHFNLVHLHLRPYKCDICHAWWGFAKHDVMRHKNAVHLKSTYECTLCISIFHTDLNLRNHYKAKHNCKIRFKGHYGPEVESVFPLTPSGAENVTGNPNKPHCLVDVFDPEKLTRKRKHKDNSPLMPKIPLSGPPPPGPPVPPQPVKKEVDGNATNQRLLLYECASCGNRYGHKDLIKFHLTKKHGVAAEDFEAEERLRKILSPYNRFAKTIYESVRRQHPELPSTEHSKIVGNIWRDMPEEDKTKWREEEEAERNNLKIVYDKVEKLWVKRFMCMKCDGHFNSEEELSTHCNACFSSQISFF